MSENTERLQPSETDTELSQAVPFIVTRCLDKALRDLMASLNPCDLPGYVPDPTPALIAIVKLAVRVFEQEADSRSNVEDAVYSPAPTFVGRATEAFAVYAANELLPKGLLEAGRRANAHHYAMAIDTWHKEIDIEPFLEKPRRPNEGI